MEKIAEFEWCGWQNSMEEDEDRVLLSSLGITSANPEEIERNILSEVLASY